MNRIDKVSKIQNINKEEEIHELLLDLLPNMGFQDVTLTHERGNRPENGKDVVASVIDTIENKKEWTAFVVKKGDVKGTSLGVQEIKAQIIDCLEYSWNSIQKGKDIKINKVKVVVNGKYNAGAIDKILVDTLLGNPNISFWGANELVDFIDRFCERIWLKGNRNYKKYIEQFQNKNREDNAIKAIGLKDDRIKKFVDNAIEPKLLEISITDSGDMKKKWFDVHSVATLTESAIIVGEPGAGKSTFFKQLSKDIIQQNAIRNDYEYYPFIIKFNELKENEFDIIKTLQNHLQVDYPEIEVSIDELKQKQNFVLFIDALDELGNNEYKEQALESIKQFRLEYDKVKIYCCSRPADSLLDSCQKLKFKYLEINNVTYQQAEQFMQRYFDEDQIKCKRLLKSLKDSNILDKLPKTPLTLALLAAIFDENQYEIPATISDLYKYFVETLLSKSIKSGNVDLLKVGIHRSILSFLAEHLHTKRMRMIERQELKELITIFSKERGHNYDIDTLINDLTIDIGLLYQNDRNEIEFKHLSFQEYFTAYQFYNHTINGKSHFIENFNDIWWQNVAIFYAGMTKDSPDLIYEILEKSVPNNFAEYIINLSGVGYLMQALYNTPIKARVEGIKRNLLNAENAAAFILETKEPQYNILKSLFNTKYGVMKVMSYWYEFHHNSITLNEPLKEVFNELISSLKQPDLDQDERIINEYSAFMVANTINSINSDISPLKELYPLVDSKNHLVVGLIDASISDEYKNLPKDDKRRKEVRKFKQKLDVLDRDKIRKSVNIRLSDGKVVGEKLKGSR